MSIKKVPLWLPLILILPLVFLAGRLSHTQDRPLPKEKTLSEENRILTGIIAETLVKSTKSWDGTLLPAYPPGQPEVTVLRITIPPGTKLPLHFHPVINAGVLTKGELRVRRADGATKILKPGEALVELVGQLHSGEALGPEAVEIIVVYAGTENGKITVKADEKLRPLEP